MNAFRLISACCLLLLLIASAPTYTNNSSLNQIELAARQGQTPAMLLLAHRYKDAQHTSQALVWAQRALESGHLAALPVLLHWYPQNERQWYVRAASFGDMNAKVRVWLTQGIDPNQVTIQPQQLKQLTQQSRTLLAEYSLQHHAPKHLPHWRSLAPNSAKWRQLLAGDEVLRRTVEHCDFTLAFGLEQQSAGGTVLHWLAQLEKLFNARGYQLCATEKMLPAQTTCTNSSGRAFCAAQPLPRGNVPIVVTKNGSANTLNGVVYINQRAHWRVLLHELGHALGLADEYPMAHALAQQFCSGHYKFNARNIVLVEPELYSLERVEQLKERLPWAKHLGTDIAQPVAVGGAIYYRLGSSDPDEVGLHTTGTCEAARIQAWKPVARQTFMEYHHAEYVPALYLQWMVEEMALRQEAYKKGSQGSL